MYNLYIICLKYMKDNSYSNIIVIFYIIYFNINIFQIEHIDRIYNMYYIVIQKGNIYNI